MYVLLSSNLLILNGLGLLPLFLRQFLTLLSFLQLQLIAHEASFCDHLNSLYFVLDFMRLHFECVIEFGHTLGLW